MQDNESGLTRRAGGGTTDQTDQHKGRITKCLWKIKHQVVWCFFGQTLMHIKDSLRELTEADESECFSSDACGAGGHFSDLLDALDPGSLAQSLVQPRVPPVQVQDVADGGVGRLFHSRRRDVTDCDPCGHNGVQSFK